MYIKKTDNISEKAAIVRISYEKAYDESGKIQQELDYSIIIFEENGELFIDLMSAPIKISEYHKAKVKEVLAAKEKPDEVV
jgi:hypothetical protein